MLLVGIFVGMSLFEPLPLSDNGALRLFLSLICTQLAQYGDALSVNFSACYWLPNNQPIFAPCVLLSRLWLLFSLNKWIEVQAVLPVKRVQTERYSQFASSFGTNNLHLTNSIIKDSSTEG